MRRLPQPMFIEGDYFEIPINHGLDTGIAVVPRLSNLPVAAPIREWIGERDEICGEKIVPITKREVIDSVTGRKEEVVLVRRSNQSPQGGNAYYYQLVCEHVEELDPENESFEDFYQCSAFLAAVAKQAVKVKGRLDHGWLLDKYRKGRNLSQGGVVVASALTKFILDYEKARPYDWAGNPITGMHLVSGLALTLDVERSAMEKVTGSMIDDGLIDLIDSETISLHAT